MECFGQVTTDTASHCILTIFRRPSRELCSAKHTNTVMGYSYYTHTVATPGLGPIPMAQHCGAGSVSPCLAIASHLASLSSTRPWSRIRIRKISYRFVSLRFGSLEVEKLHRCAKVLFFFFFLLYFIWEFFFCNERAFLHSFSPRSASAFTLFLA